MKRKTWKAVRGSVTLLLVLILIPMMTFSAVIVDTSRINMARSMVSSAGDLAMNTALANYDTILKDVYGLFAMSQGKTDEEMAKDIKKYFQETLVSYGVVNEAQSGEYVEALIGDFTEIVNGVSEVNVQNLMEMKVGDDFSVARQADSALSNPDVLRKQIVEYMKYRAPINMGMSFLDSLKAFKSVEKQNEVVETQVKAQESTQDVTSQCKKLIKLIREFDKLIESIEEGDKLVKGSAYSTDGVAVQIADYPGQVDKYASTWGQENNKENYAHTNLINLVFLAKAPSSNVYLKNLGAAKFIGSDASGNYYVVLENTGISGVTASGLGLDEAEAKTQMQINALNCTNSEPYRAQMESYASFGISLDVLDPTSNYTALKYFVDEPAAIDYYNQYVGFLQNINQNVKYSDIQTALQQILILGQYFKQYETLIDQEINNAYQLYDAAKRHMEGLQGQAMSNATSIYNAARDINNQMQNFVDSDAYGEISSIPTEAMNAVYRYYDEVNPQLYYNYSGYYNNNYKDSPNDVDDIFVKGLKGIGNSVSSYSGKSADIASAVKSYFSSGQSGSILSYVTGQVKNASEDPLYALVSALYRSHQKAENVPGYITSYDQAMAQLPAAIQDHDAKKATYEGWVARKAGVVQQMNSCLSWYKPYVDVYQEDVIIYDKYMQTAQNIVTRETSAINTQFTKIKTNIDEIIKKLTAIEEQIVATADAMTAYNQNLNAWESANNTYASENQQDSFSKQNSADIAAARNQYDSSKLELLKTQVTSLKTEYNDFYTLLTDATHFKYGSLKVNAISDYTAAKNAVSSAAASWAEIILSAEFANGKFASLYNTEATPALEISADASTPYPLYFLRPVLPIQILKYLNETYPEQEEQTEEQKAEEANYEKVKADLKGEGEGSQGKASGKDVSDDTDVNKYGYTYKGKSINQTGLPSAGEAPKTVSKQTFELKEKGSEEEKKVDVSSSVSSQSDSLGTVLSGIGEVLEAGIENLYILTYLFENFSYNTMIQDAIIKDGNISGNDGVMTAAQNLIDENLETYKDQLRMLSNFPKNGTHNYIYGAEIEYVLFGNTSASDNVTYTKASIYAMRFGFNCIYAFTNSEIRNTTMSAGLAVQAATLGVVPYQVVQIVLQLALAAAESAIDLQMMNLGLRVAVVKTTDTWMLSLSNAVREATATVITGVVNTAADVASNAIKDTAAGLQDLVDAGAEEVSGAVDDLCSNFTTAMKKEAQDIIDAAFSLVTGKIENVLNDLQYVVLETKSQAISHVEAAFTEVKGTIRSELTALASGNEIAEQFLDDLLNQADRTVDDVKNIVVEKINAAADTADISEELLGELTNIKIAMMQKVSQTVNTFTTVAYTKINGLITSVTDDLKNTIGETGEKLSEETAQAIKDKANGYINQYLDVGNKNAVGGMNSNGSTSSSVAAMIKFGYKDYLMLLTYIAICTKGDQSVERIADLIQLNINHASTAKGSTYQHANYLEKNPIPFQMNHAWTYLTVSTSVELEMLFMNMDIFANMVADEETTVDGAFSQNAKITYNGLLGY